uniref:Hypothetical plastid protein n=1 Tax=Gracilaria tenuistipitata var. liui TaxID=285951 RepID=Q6B8P9_GRATL|nr:hypothetical plastid protein [Gracilaria tenuistipitata var. liui]AAT79736.1 hypothetical plastid protein [Gracilaria tenuistipitata var. liui]
MPFFLFHLILTITSLFSHNCKKTHSVNYYAMVSNLYFKKILKANKFSSTHVKINKCNRYLLYKMQSFKENSYNKPENFNLKKTDLYKYICILQNSGCISSITRYTIFYPKYKQSIFNINIYPVINKINILKYKKLKICSKFLEKLFKKQLGLPKNYLLIDSIINKIHAWYVLQGYHWSSINIYNKHKANEMHIVINEGKIYRIYLKCKTKQLKKNMKSIN